MLFLVWACKKHFLSALIFCLLSLEFLSFVFAPFSIHEIWNCHGWMNKWMNGWDLCTDTETGKVWVWFFFLGVFFFIKDLDFWDRTKCPAVFDPWTRRSVCPCLCGQPRWLWSAVVQLWHLTNLLHGWTAKNGGGEPFISWLPVGKLISRCYWVRAPPGGWKKRNHREKNFSYISLPYSSPSGIPSSWEKKHKLSPFMMTSQVTLVLNI